MVFRFVRDSEGLALRYLAFGVRHHPRDSNAQTAYEIAHRRLETGGDLRQCVEGLREEWR